MVFTLHDFALVQPILEAAQGNRRVARVIDDRLFYGTALSLGDAHGNVVHGDVDVRDLYLRVLVGFTDAYWSVRDLMPQVGEGSFVVDPFEPALTS